MPTFIARALLLFAVFAVPCFSAAPTLIPRSPTPVYRSDVFFEGGSGAAANLEGLRMAPHGQFERWVIDFADEKGMNKTAIAPKFQVRFIPAEKIESETGEMILGRPAKLIINIERVKQNRLNKSGILALIKKSSHVDKITVYPPVENGNTAMEFTFSSEAPVNIHQPLEKEGRLVIDIAKVSPPPAKE
jgi:hypothetical protein